MTVVSNSLKRKGYRNVVFNINDKSFYSPVEGDNYSYVGTAGDGGSDGSGTFQTSGTLPLDNATRLSVNPANLPDYGGLKTQADYNNWVHGALTQLDELGGAESEISLDGYATEAWVEAKKYITTVSSLPALPG
mgnify:CR=1 FL=1